MAATAAVPAEAYPCKPHSKELAVQEHEEQIWEPSPLQVSDQQQHHGFALPGRDCCIAAAATLHNAVRSAGD